MPARPSRKRKHETEPRQVALPAIAGTGSSRVILLACLSLIVVGATFYAHWPALSAQALSFDDQQYLTDNPLVQHPGVASAGRFLLEVLEPSTVDGYYQPLAMISLMLDYAIGGRPDNLRPFHRTSLALHLANTALIVVLLYALFGQPWVAAMVGLLFGVHPMTVEPIPWIGERKTLLAAFFALWCLIVYVRYARRPGWKLHVTCLVLYVLALMSKPTSTPLPVVMLLLDFWPLRRLSKRAIIEKLPFLFVGAVFGAITVISQARTASVETPGEYPLVRVPLILCHNIIFYPCKILWPAHLSSHYPFPQPPALSHPMVLAGVIGTCVLIPALLISLRWTRALLTGWLIFFVAIFPTMGVLGFTIVIASDKYAYLPAVGLLLILGGLLERIWLAGTGSKRRVRRIAALAVVLTAAGLLMVDTRHYLVQWQTTEGHNRYMLSLAPNSPELYNNSGWSHDYEKKYDLAIRDYTQAIELNPGYARAYYNRGITYDSMRDYDLAIRDYTRAVEIMPDYAYAYGNRGVSFEAKGDYVQAIRDYDKAIELRPGYTQAYYNRANAYLAADDARKAIGDYNRAIEINPEYVMAYNNRGNAFNRIGDHDQAIRDYAKVIELKPDDAGAYLNRGNAYMGKRNYDSAIRDYTRSIELKPDNPLAYSNRGSAYDKMGSYDRAILDCTRAIELKPDYANAYHNRAMAYCSLKEYDKAWADVKMCRQLGRTPGADLVRKLMAATGRSE